jgi:hypothetical protein
MDQGTYNQFDSIEDAQGYVRTLRAAVEEARRVIQDDLAETTAIDEGRRADALQLTDYKLVLLDKHLRDCGRLLNDLRTLRRALSGERKFATPAAPEWIV